MVSCPFEGVKLRGLESDYEQVLAQLQWELFDEEEKRLKARGDQLTMLLKSLLVLFTDKPHCYYACLKALIHHEMRLKDIPQVDGEF